MRARHRQPGLHRHRLAQGVDAGAAFERQALDLLELVLGRIADHADADRHLLERRRRRIRHHVAAHVEIRARHRLEAVVAHAELGGVEGEHRRIAADRAGEQEFERRRRAVLPAHMHRFADDEFVAALLAVDELVELADRGHLHFHEAARPFGRRLLGMRTVPTLARVGDILQLGEAIADLDHPISPGRACGMSCALSCARTRRVKPAPSSLGLRSRCPDERARDHSLLIIGLTTTRATPAARLRRARRVSSTRSWNRPAAGRRRCRSRNRPRR